MKDALKVPDPKFLENDFYLNRQIWSLFQSIIKVKKLQYMYFISKQFEKTMFMLLIVL